METLLQAAHQEPVPPARLVSRVPRDLDTICLKCLEKEPGRRYATAGELAADLGRFLNHEPIRARPVGPLGRLARWGRRNPVGAALLGALMVTGLAAFAAIVWQRRSAEYARRVADAFARSEAAVNVRLEEQRRRAVEAQQQAELSQKAERWERYRATIAAASAALQIEHSDTAARAAPAPGARPATASPSDWPHGTAAVP
jgi:hypothetical protein